MSAYSIIFAGFGGQGVLFSGKIVAYIGMLLGKEVSWLPSYGPEMRGGTANCSVRIDDNPIGSPLVTEPDVLVAMNGPSFDKFIDSVKPGGQVVIDSAMVLRENSRDDVDVYDIPAAKLAKEEGLEGMANIIMLGKMLREAPVAALETVEKALLKCIPPVKAHLLEPNMRAIRLGMSL